MIASEIKMYNLLKAKLGEADAETFMEVFEDVFEHKFDMSRNNIATRDDLSALKVGLVKWTFAFWVTIMMMIICLFLKGS